jgi:hypothetical protein
MARYAYITPKQAEELATMQLVDGAYFSPKQDVNGYWCISAEEIRDCVTVDWVKDLEVVEVEIPVTDLELPNEND